jgi:hypothetical protein
MDGRGGTVIVRRWLAEGRSATMLVALFLLSLVAAVPASEAQSASSPHPSVEQSQVHQALFVKRVSAKFRVAQPNPFAAADFGGTYDFGGRAPKLALYGCAPATPCTPSRLNTPYQARAPPAA